MRNFLEIVPKFTVCRWIKSAINVEMQSGCIQAIIFLRFALFTKACMRTVPPMKRLAPWTLLLVTALVIVAPFAMAAATSTAVTREDRSPVAPIASAISAVTGIAISPLLGTGAYGAYKWVRAGNDVEREKLPWFAQPHFWLPALLIVGACALKDALGATVPTGLKKPLDVLETIENKFSGLIAAGAVIPFVMGAMTKMIFDDGGTKAVASVTPFIASSGLATIHLGAIDFTWLLNLLTVPFGIAVFVLVWLASHAINVLILLSPWGAIDGVLKAARTGLLGLVTLSATINPMMGAALSVVVIILAYLVAGWAFRLMVFGTVFSWEFITRRRCRYTPSESGNKMFAGPAFTAVPVRTYGQLVEREDGGLEFHYRPWILLESRVARVELEQRVLAVGEGVLFSDIVDAEDRTIFSLPPRYHGHEEQVARIFKLGRGVCPVGLNKAWSELREMLGGRAIKKEPLAA